MKVRIWEENVEEMRIHIKIGDHSIDMTLPKGKKED